RWCPQLFLHIFVPVTVITEIYTLSLHGALPIFVQGVCKRLFVCRVEEREQQAHRNRLDALGADALHDLLDAYRVEPVQDLSARGDRKSTRLNSSHVKISYAVFCLKKKKKVKP